MDTDIPVIRKQFNDVVVTEVVGGVEAMRLCPFRVDVGVVHDEKDAMRGDRRDKCLLGLARVRVTQGWIESGDQIEAARGNRGIFESGLHPQHVDGACRARCAACSSATRETSSAMTFHPWVASQMA
jgi:hypothetical protein